MYSCSCPNQRQNAKSHGKSNTLSTIAIASHQRLTGQRGFSTPRTSTSSNTPILIQPKFTIGAPGDKYEQEAERVAEQVMRIPESRLQRQAAPDEEEEDELLQTKPLGQRQVNEGGKTPSETPNIVHEVLRSPSRPLDTATRTFMEPRFDHDFSQIRVHTDAKAARAAHAVNARAFTLGRHVVFGAGEHTQTSSGSRLLAHELAHVIQQQGSQDSTLARKVVDPSTDAQLRQVLIDQLQTSSVLPSSAASYYILRTPPVATDPSETLREGESLIDAILNTVRALRPTLDRKVPPDPNAWIPVAREVKLALSDAPTPPAMGILEATAYGYKLYIEVLVPQLLPEGTLGRTAVKQAIAEGRLSDVQLVSHMEIKHTEVQLPPLNPNPKTACTPVPPDQIVWKRTSAGKLHIDAGGEGKHPEANNLNWGGFVTGGGIGPGLEAGDPIRNLVCGNLLSTWPIGDRQADIITVESARINPIEMARVIKDGGWMSIIESELGNPGEFKKLLDELGLRVGAVRITADLQQQLTEFLKELGPRGEAISVTINPQQDLTKAEIDVNP